MNEVFGLNKAAWETWVAYRRKIRKPLKEVSHHAAQVRLASFGDFEQQMESVLTSIANGWQGVFPPGKKSPWETKKEAAKKNAQLQEAAEFCDLDYRARQVGFRAAMQGEELSQYRFLVERAERNEADRKYRESLQAHSSRFVQ